MQDIQFCVVGPYCTSTEDTIFYTFFHGGTASNYTEYFAGGFIWLRIHVNVNLPEIFTCWDSSVGIHCLQAVGYRD